jgi:hypothetical protein
VGRDLLHRLLSCRTGPRHCTDAFGSDSWFGGRDWLQSVALLFLNIVSCLESVVHLPDFIQGPADTQVTPDSPPCSSLCSQGDRSGLIVTVRRRILSGALVYHSLQSGIFIRPSSFYAWRCYRKCLSILGSVQSLTSCRMGGIPGRSAYSHSSSYTLDVCLLLAVITQFSAW